MSHDPLVARAWRRSRLVAAVHGTTYSLRPVLGGLLLALVVAGALTAPGLIDRLTSADEGQTVSRGR